MTTAAARLWQGARGVSPVLLLTGVVFVGFAAGVRGFASPANVEALLIGGLPLLLLAIGQTFVIVSGGIDLSAPALVGLCSIAGGILLSADTGFAAPHALVPVGGALAMLVTGALAGLLNGVCVGRLGMPAFMVTLTTGMFAGGLAVFLVRLVADAETLFNLPGAFVTVGSTPALAAAVAGGCAVTAQGLLGTTAYGRMLQAVGCNWRTAVVSGVRFAPVVAGAYVISGTCAAVAAILITGSLETASPTHGRPLLLDVIGATVIGGASLTGGRGHVGGTAAGVLFLAVLGNGLTLLSLSEFVITIVKGLVILAAATIDLLRAPR